MKIPQIVENFLIKLERNGYQAFVVGGCVRDLLRGVEPADWDIATDARPEEIINLFERSYYDNKFFTVTVLTESRKESLKKIEITTFRKESRYTDKRHPDKVEFAFSIEQDLKRRDFTINAIALDKNLKIVDPFSGRKDLENKIIRAVGNPQRRFSEDALRMMRAIRFKVSLGNDWKIEKKTREAISENAFWINAIAKERIRDEFIKIIISDRPAEGIEELRKLSLLKYIIPELLEGYKVSQNKHHIYDCYTHYLKSLEYAGKRKFNLYVRLAALFHDIGKPRTKRGEGPDATFYGHEIVSAKMTAQILLRLKFSKKDIEKIVKLVRYHLFYFHPDEVSESAVRRLIRQVGLENMEELIEVRICDRIGSGCPKAEPYKLRYLRYLIEKLSRDPLSVKMLKVNGNDILNILKIKPSPKVGQILNILLDEVISDPKKNKREILLSKIKKLKGFSDKEIEKLSQKAKERIEKIEKKRDEMTKRKYWLV